MTKRKSSVTNISKARSPKTTKRTTRQPKKAPWSSVRLPKLYIALFFVFATALVGIWVLSRGSAATAYKLYWSDEFNGTSINTTNWKAYNSTYGDGNNEEACLTPNNIVISGGTAKIVAKKEAITCPNNKGRSYSSGFLSSRDAKKYFPKFAKYEIRAKLPHGQGLWPAFWLRHKNGASTAEVDVMEYFHSQLPGKTTATLHLDGQKNIAKRSQSFEDATDSPQWHTWSVEISPVSQGSQNAKFTFYLDGKDYFSYTPKQQNWATSVPEDQMFDVAINLAIGGNYVGHPEDELGWSRYLERCLKPYGGRKPCDGSGIKRASFPSTYEIDYVRVYTLQQAVDDGSVTVPQDTKLSTVSGLTATPNNGQVTLRWDKVPNADNYTVRWGTNGKWTNYSNEKGNSYNPKTNSYTISNLSNGVKYNFSVAARSNSGSYAKGEYSTTIESIPSVGSSFKLSTPTGLTATPNNGQVTLRWDKVPNADNYTVRWGTNGKWTNYSNEKGNSYNPKTNSYTISNLSNGVKYNFSVAARSERYSGSNYSGVVSTVPVR